MKKICLLITLLFSLLTFSNVSAQSGYQENYYYSTRGSVNYECGNTVAVFVGYDGWGNAIYNGIRYCRKTVWHSYTGWYTGYYWYNGYWQSSYEYRTWWYYTWVDYTVRVY